VGKFGKEKKKKGMGEVNSKDSRTSRAVVPRFDERRNTIINKSMKEMKVGHGRNDSSVYLEMREEEKIMEKEQEQRKLELSASLSRSVDSPISPLHERHKDFSGEDRPRKSGGYYPEKLKSDEEILHMVYSYTDHEKNFESVLPFDPPTPQTPTNSTGSPPSSVSSSPKDSTMEETSKNLKKVPSTIATPLKKIASVPSLPGTGPYADSAHQLNTPKQPPTSSPPHSIPLFESFESEEELKEKDDDEEDSVLQLFADLGKLTKEEQLQVIRNKGILHFRFSILFYLLILLLIVPFFFS
jgi:hypothetical protein